MFQKNSENKNVNNVEINFLKKRGNGSDILRKQDEFLSSAKSKPFSLGWGDGEDLDQNEEENENSKSLNNPEYSKSHQNLDNQQYAFNKSKNIQKQLNNQEISIENIEESVNEFEQQEEDGEEEQQESNNEDQNEIQEELGEDEMEEFGEEEQQEFNQKSNGSLEDDEENLNVPQKQFSQQKKNYKKKKILQKKQNDTNDENLSEKSQQQEQQSNEYDNESGEEDKDDELNSDEQIQDNSQQGASDVEDENDDDNSKNELEQQDSKNYNSKKTTKINSKKSQQVQGDDDSEEQEQLNNQQIQTKVIQKRGRKKKIDYQNTEKNKFEIFNYKKNVQNSTEKGESNNFKQKLGLSNLVNEKVNSQKNLNSEETKQIQNVQRFPLEIKQNIESQNTQNVQRQQQQQQYQQIQESINCKNIILDNKTLRQKIKQRLQLHGYYNFKNSSQQQNFQWFYEMVNEIMEIQLQKMIQDLLNIQRTRCQFIPLNNKIIMGDEYEINYVSQNELLNYNFKTENLYQQQINQNLNSQRYEDQQFIDVNTENNQIFAPKKEVFNIVCLENIHEYNQILELEEKKRAVVLEEQLEVRKQLENLAKQKLASNQSNANIVGVDKENMQNSDQILQQNQDINQKKDQVAEQNDNVDDQQDLDYIIDPQTGKKISKKKFLINFHNGVYTPQQIQDLEKKGYLKQLLLSFGLELNSQKQQDLDFKKLQSKEYDLGQRMLKICDNQNNLEIVSPKNQTNQQLIINQYIDGNDHSQKKQKVDIEQAKQDQNQQLQQVKSTMIGPTILNIQNFQSKQMNLNFSQQIIQSINIQHGYLLEQLSDLKKQQQIIQQKLYYQGNQFSNSNQVQNSSANQQLQAINKEITLTRRMVEFQTKVHQDKVNVKDLIIYLNKNLQGRCNGASQANIQSCLQKGKLTQFLYELLNSIY